MYTYMYTYTYEIGVFKYTCELGTTSLQSASISAIRSRITCMYVCMHTHTHISYTCI